MQVPVGSRTETEQNNGISHFLEHMVFTGTERWDEAAVTDVVRRRGAECNAQTSREETDYYIHVAASDLEFGMDWLHQLVFKPTLTPEKFEKERQVIINEKGGEYDALRRAWIWLEDRNLGWSVGRAVRRRLFPDSSLLLPVVGTDQSLHALTHDNLQRYYETYYTPNNMTLLVVGDADPEQVFAAAERQFGEISARSVPPPHSPITVVDRPFHVRLRGPTPNQQGQLYIGASLGPSNHPDRFGWSLMAEMLENAYLQAIRYNRGLSYDVSVYPVLYTDAGYFNIYTSAQIDDFDTIQELIETQLNRLVEGTFSERELAEAKAALRGRALLNLQDNLECAWWFSSDALAMRRDDGPVADYFAEIERLTAEDIRHMAQKYLALERRFVVEHRPALTPRSLRRPLKVVGVAGLAGTALFLKHRRRMAHARKSL